MPPLLLCERGVCSSHHDARLAAPFDLRGVPHRSARSAGRPVEGDTNVQRTVPAVTRGGAASGTVVADGFLYVDSLRVYQVNGLRLRVHSEGK